MKKIIAMAVVAAVAVSMVCAQIGVTAGVKGTFGMNLGSTVTDEGKALFTGGESIDLTNKVMVGGGGLLYGRYNMPFHAPLGVQLELGIFANNGVKVAADETFKDEDLGVDITVEATGSASYLSMDIPLIVTYDISAGPVVITPMVGVNFSIPLGKMKAKMEITTKADGESIKMEETEDLDIASKFIPGIVAGVEVGLPLGPGSLVADLRYVNDFTKFSIDIGEEGMDPIETGIRRNFNISLGYAMKF